MKLEKFETTIEGLELYIDISSPTKEVYASQRGLARMCGVVHSTIQKAEKAGSLVPQKTAEIPTGAGLRSGSLFDEDAIETALWKYNPELLRQCMKAGLRVYLHGLAGFRYEIKASLPELPKLVGSSGDVKDLYLVAKGLADDGDLQLSQLVKITLGNQLLALNDGAKSDIIELEGAVECSIRLGFKVPKNYESSLGKYVKKRCSHLLQGQNNRYSQASAIQIQANMYPKGNPEVEEAVTDYCILKSLT